MQLLPFKIERYFAKYEFTVKYLLCSSNCESLAIQDLLALESQAPDLFQKLWLGYTESQGATALKLKHFSFLRGSNFVCLNNRSINRIHKVLLQNLGFPNIITIDVAAEWRRLYVDR